MSYYHHFNPLFPRDDNFRDSCNLSAWLHIIVRRNGIVVSKDTDLVATGQKYASNENFAVLRAAFLLFKTE